MGWVHLAQATNSTLDSRHTWLLSTKAGALLLFGCRVGKISFYYEFSSDFQYESPVT